MTEEIKTEQTDIPSENENEKEKLKPKKKEKKQGAQREKLEAELSEQKDAYLRLCAEYDNYRKRTAKEKDEIYGNAVSNTVKSLLPVIDNFERAFAAEYEQNDFAKGIELIYKQFGEYLNGLGITETGKPGDEFDPELHYAVAHCDDDTLGENVIAEVLQKGFMLGDKVLRPAMVKVAN